MLANYTTLGAAYMIASLSGLVPRLKIARARIIERKPNLMSEQNDNEDPLEKRKKRLELVQTCMSVRWILYVNRLALESIAL